MGENGDNSGATKIFLLPKYGEETEALPAERFVSMVDRMKTQQGWDDEKTASNAIEALKGKAATWAENLVKKDETKTKTWAEFKKAFLERWNRVRSLGEKANLLFNLNMRKSETAEDFHDRVEFNITAVTKDKIDSFATAPEKRAACAMAEDFATWLFVNGLTAPIKEKVETEHSLNTNEQVVKIARAAEIGLRRNKGAAVHAIDEVNKSGGKKPEGKKKGKGKQQESKKKPTDQKGGWIFCYNCKQWGKHVKKDCRRSPAEVAELTPGNPYIPPKGEATDETESEGYSVYDSEN